MSNLISPGAGAVLLLLLSALTLIALSRLRRMRELGLQLRKLPAFSDLRREMGRATESGRPIHLALGSGALGGAETITSLAGLQMLEGLVDAAASYDTPPVITVGDPTLLLLAQDVLRRAYERRQISELYSPDQVRFVAPSSLAYSAGALPTGVPEDVTATIAVGAFGSDASLIADTSSRRSTPQLTAVDSPQAIGALYPAVDHLAVGEELYAIGSQVTEEEKYQTGLMAQDALRLVLALVIVLAAAWALIGG